MIQIRVDKIIVSTEQNQIKINDIMQNVDISIKEKVKALIPLLMSIHNILYQNAYNRAKSLVDLEWVASETKRKDAIKKHRYNTDFEYRMRINAYGNANTRLNKLKRELF
jgi:hypothetical protein